MSKRKRNNADSSEMVPLDLKKPSRGRRKADTNEDDDIICIDLEEDSETENKYARTSSKKKRIDDADATTKKKGGEPSSRKSNQQRPMQIKQQSPNRHRRPPPVAERSVKQGQDTTMEITSTKPQLCDSKSVFKVPDIPCRDKGASTSTAAAAAAAATTSTLMPISTDNAASAGDIESKLSLESRNKKENETPSAKQLANTLASRNLRKAFIGAIQDALEDTSLDYQKTIEDLLHNLSSCFPRRLFTFATRRLPEGAKYEDVSQDSEIEEFTRWWLFGVTALLFSCPEHVAKNNLLKANDLLTNLCQLVLCGHPSVIDKISVQLLSVLRDLLVRNGNDIEKVPVLKIDLFRTNEDSGNKEYFHFKIKLTENNEWIIPSYIQAISPFIRRVCFYDIKLFYLLNDILQKLLKRLTSPATVETVLALFPDFVLTGTHKFYMTEAVFSKNFMKVLEAPMQPTVDIVKMRGIFNRYEIAQNHGFAEFLQDSGLGFLQMDLKSSVYKGGLAQVSKIDLNKAIVQAFSFVHSDSLRFFNSVKEDVPLIRLVTEVGLETVLHPLLEQNILTEIMSPQSEICKNQHTSCINPRNASTVWDQVFILWEELLTQEYRSLGNFLDAATISTKDQQDIVTFFTNTATLTKLVRQLLEQLRREGYQQKFEFFELKHLQRWSDITFQWLANGPKLKPINLYRLYYAILETLENLDACNWFGATLSAKLLSNLICIPGWMWLSSFESCISQSLKPLPMFTRNFANKDLQFIRGSSLLLSKAIRTLRLERFRPFCPFVSEIYHSIMVNETTMKDPFLVNELLDAMSAVSWIFKEVIPLKLTFCFLKNLIETDLWKGHSSVRSSLAAAIVALPCICCHNLYRNRRPSPLVSASGCEMEKCATFSLAHSKAAANEGDEQLPSLYITSIFKLAWPLLKSKFLMVKISLSHLISSCHNHIKSPATSVIVPMIAVALNGHDSLCQVIFKKVGLVVANAVPKGLEDNNTNGADVEIAQKIFSDAIPELCKRKRKNRTNRLSLRTREKIMRGIVAFSTVGPMNMSIFVEILKCIIPIVAQTRGNENSVTILSQKIVTRFAEVHICYPHELMTRVRYEISKCIVQCAIKEFYEPNISGTESSVASHEQRVLMCVKFIERVKYIGKFRLTFARNFYPPLMERVVPNLSDPRYQFLLFCMASHEKNTEPIMLQEYIMNYFPTLLLDHSSESITKCLQHLKNNYGFDAMFAAKEQEQRILNEALCRLCDREEKVHRFLSHLCKWDEQSINMIYNRGTANKGTRSELQDLLSRRLLGFFIHLDTKLQSRVETVETKQNILRSFTALIKLMGKNKITPVRFKVYKTLYSATKQGPQFHKVLYEAWKEFSYNLDSASFASMTTQILASLLPLRESPSVCTKVDGLVSHFVCYRKDLTVNHHRELYFLLDQCDAVDATQAIRQAVDKMKKDNWSNYFNMIVKEASNENPPIRFEAFRKLRDIFRFDWELVEKYVLVKGQQYVSHLLSTLLAGLRGTGNSEDEKLRRVIVDCFGCLGALDPVRFRSEGDEGNSKNILSTTLAISSQMNTFAVLYLGELIREFQEVKDTTNFDYCACLIQIVLKEFKVAINENDKIWRYLNKEQQDIITPMFTTKYHMDYGMDLSNIGCPIYLSEHGKSFEGWLINWMCVLITYITEKEPQAYTLFRKSMNVLKTNVRIATFILPFVTMYAIFCASPFQLSSIVTEIKTVLERWVVLDELKQKVHNTVPVKDSEMEQGVLEEPLSVENESIFHARCTQVTFSILDHLLRSSSVARRRWGQKRAADNVHHRLHDQKIVPQMNEDNLTAVESVLKQIPPLLISEVACNCASFPAALYYLEQVLKDNPCEETLQTNVDYLQRLYICLDDMDSVGGIAAVRRGDPSFSGQTLENIVNGKTQEFVQSLEQMAIREPDDFQLHQVLVRAYLQVEEPHAAETFINATLVRQPEWETDLQEVHMQALLKLQKWPELSTKAKDVEEMKKNPFLEDKFLSWPVAIPCLISKLQLSQTESAIEMITELKAGLVATLVATCTEMYPYKRAYPDMIRLHILTEVDEVIKLIRKYSNCVAAAGKSGSTSSQGWVYKEVTRLISKWEARLWNVSKSRKLIDQILNVRKSIYQILKQTFSFSAPICDVLNTSIRECWLDIARDASKCGDFVRADNCLREAKLFMSPKVMIEEAKILSRKGEKENSISTLRKGIKQYFPQLDAWKKEQSIVKPSVVGNVNVTAETTSSHGSKLLCSKALLLLARLCEEQKLLDMEDYIAKYKEAADVYKESEKNFFTLGSYHDRLWSAADKTQPNFDIQATVVRYYCQSLHYGCKYVYQSLPRLLSIWFDFAAGVQTGEFIKFNASGIPLSVPSTSSTNSSNSSNGGYYKYNSPSKPDACLDIMNKSILLMSQTVPAYVLMTAFTQLVSRLCHSHSQTWNLLKEIIVRIICTHPCQTLWMTMAVGKSINNKRRLRCMEIYKSVESRNPAMKGTIRDYTSLTEKFIELCDVKVDKNFSKTSLAKICDRLPKLIRQMGAATVVVPFQIFMNPSLPRKGISHKDHNPYPESLVYIYDIDDSVDVMSSLARPKKITITATNGKRYGLLCKPKDDLRKDGKVMEINNVVNWYLSQNSESSQRRLHVRMYSVVPLNETCGLLEWVPNLTTYRQVLLTIYKEKNISYYKSGVPGAAIYKDDSLKEKRRKFIDIWLKQTPPVFSDWFFNQFNDHQSWYTARMSYIRTAAVISIVGYIMGLGDRHGENILLDSVTGEVVHVDFNCLFNKGESFDWSERVPFRLTQNMVEGMGPLKYEGVFRRTCEIVLNMFREHKSIFLSVLRPFVFDPLVEWQREPKGIRTAATLEAGEHTNEEAVGNMKYIRHRLNGTARNWHTDINTDLSVKAHVNYLIEEATSVDNLCQMWIGWAAYM